MPTRPISRWNLLTVAVVALGAALAASPAAGGMHGEKSMPPVVVDRGVTPDGTRYQHVLFHKVFSFRTNARKNKATFTAWCKQFRLLADPPRNNGGHCAGDTGPQPPAGSIAAVTPPWPSLVTPGKADSDVYVIGETSSRVDRVRVVYTDPSGAERDLAVDFAKLEGPRAAKVAKRMRARTRRALRAKLGKRRGRRAGRRIAMVRPYGVYTAFLPGAVSVRDDLAGRAKAADAEDPNQVGHDPIETGNLGGLTMDEDRCDLSSGPFRAIAYGADGHEIEADLCLRSGGATAR
jgi:hypothetical protein